MEGCVYVSLSDLVALCYSYIYTKVYDWVLYHEYFISSSNRSKKKNLIYIFKG